MSIELVMIVPPCDHCGRGSEEKLYVPFYRDTVKLLELAAPGISEIDDAPLERAILYIDSIVTRLLSEPLLFAEGANNSQPRYRYWSEYGQVVDGLGRFAKGAKELKSGTLKVFVKEEK